MPAKKNKTQLKNQKKKEKRKLGKQKSGQQDEVIKTEIKHEERVSKRNVTMGDYEIEYVTDPVQIAESNETDQELLQHFLGVFQAFRGQDDDDQDEEREQDEDDTENDKQPLSNKQKKKMRRMSIAVLKGLVSKPDLVEAWDTTASDPQLLVTLKSHHNTVPVPRHWNQKRKYLQGKRGIEKAPFQLPEFIAATGISRIREAITEKEAGKSVSQRARDRMQPKLGKMDIDYQVLHDAFFKYQTRPKMTRHGDLYYEGKEFEVTLKEKRPGALSEDLKRALGMPEGAPPPWLLNMQKFGPPPSYPNLKIPGVNAPIPEGARYGFHAGGWGKPLLDEFGRPLFSTTATEEVDPWAVAPEKKTLWGELADEENDEDEDEHQMMTDMLEDDDALDQEDQRQVGFDSGLETPSGLATPSGFETPDALQLRKAPVPTPADDESYGKQLYSVLPQETVSVGSGLMGSAHRYVIPQEKRELKATGQTVRASSRGVSSNRAKEVQVALTPEEVARLEEKGEEVLKAKFEESQRGPKVQREDVSDMVVQHQREKNAKIERDKEKKKKKDAFRF